MATAKKTAVEKWPVDCKLQAGSPVLERKRKLVAEEVIALANTANTSDQLLCNISEKFGCSMNVMNSGAYRLVYKLPYNLVLKVDQNSSHSNRTEIKCAKKYPKIAPKIYGFVRHPAKSDNIYSRPIDIIVAERVKPLDSNEMSSRHDEWWDEYEKIVRKYKVYDCGERNAGMTEDGRIVFHDLGNGLGIGGMNVEN